jgi:hypothetical protein
MEQSRSTSYQPPEVDDSALHKRRLLEAEAFSLDAQMRGFGPIRERLSAQGKNPSEHYGALLARRAEIAGTLGRQVPSTQSSLPDDVHIPGPSELLLLGPIAAAKFDHVLGSWLFGSTGSVQLAPAQEGVNDVVHGKHPSSGTITTVPGAYPGIVTYRGLLEVGPESIPPDQYDPTPNYFWVHNWKYLVPIPPPSTQSVLTYRFEVYARTNVFFEGGEGQAMAFVSLGETADLTTGTNLTPNIDGGWPLMTDLTQPGPAYNGHYGYVDGSVMVQRSFTVGANHVPGIAIVVGAIASLSMMTRLNLSFVFDSSIGISSEGVGGRLTYSYTPVLVAQA